MSDHFDILFIDLDGTLLTTDKKVSPLAMEALHQLHYHGIHRVIATGRSYYSLQKVISNDFPVDFLIFSSGAGIMDNQEKKLLFNQPFGQDEVKEISQTLMEQDLDFMVHGPVPDNHHFLFYQHRKNNEDFNRRLKIYRGFCQPFRKLSELPASSAQIIAILPDDLELFNAVAARLNHYQITRATSPLDHQSIWLELYPLGVSKGNGAKWLCDHLNLDHRKTLAIGNDYNDIDLLDFTGLSYMVANAPEDLRGRYLQTTSNDDHGVYQAILAAGGAIKLPPGL